MSSIPLVILPHLVPFLVSELTGKIHRDSNLYGKQVPIYISSSLGGVICAVNNAQVQNKEVKYYLVLNHVAGALSSHCTGSIHDQKGNIIQTDARGNKLVNDLLDNMLRTALYFWVSGSVDSNEAKKSVQQAIESFMHNYKLYDHDYSLQQLRRLYYESLRKKSKLSQFQKVIPHTSIHASFYVTKKD
ncbi:hypothetical protein [Nonlabens dokdonensis]|uniref:hypothetical protein n=1 Tax=Nonlabens dokdonensis TaxID=328515 RepID=UPI0026F11325|nr:hypothetical protein [Nonlabens dokdonensis]